MLHPKVVQFLEGGVAIEYVEIPDGMRQNGMVLNSYLFIPEPVAPDALEELLEAAQRALVAGQEAFEASPIIEPEDYDEEEASPWDNPTERTLPR